MLNVKSFDILFPNYNQDVVDVVERAWIKSTATTKEQKDKNLFDIFHTFLNRINKSFTSNSNAELSDLILEKSVYIVETTGIHEWPNVESLKQSDLHRTTVMIYNYLKYKFHLVHYVKLSQSQHSFTTVANSKNIKDSSFKSFENLVKLIEGMMDVSFTDELIYSIFNDFFLFYVKARDSNQSEENRNKSLEDMEAIIQMLLEETNIQGLAKMNSIDSTAQRYFYLGCLTLILGFKFNHFEKSEIISGVESTLESISRHIQLLKEISPILYFQSTIVRSLNHFLRKENIDFSILEELLDSYKSLKVYIKFRKNVTISKSLTNFLTVSKYLLLFHFVVLGVKVDSNLLSFLEIQDLNLVGLSLKNTIIINSLINQSNLSLLTEWGQLENLRNKLTYFTERQIQNVTTIDLDSINSVLEKVYQKNKFYQLDNNDILSASSKSHGLFKETRKLLEGI